MNKIQKILDFTCQECHSAYQLLEIHQVNLKNSSDHCLDYWKQLLHNHYQEQIMLYLAQEEMKLEGRVPSQAQNDPDHEN